MLLLFVIIRRETLLGGVMVAFEMRNVESIQLYLYKKICSHVPCVFQDSLLIGQTFVNYTFKKISMCTDGPQIFKIFKISCDSRIILAMRSSCIEKSRIFILQIVPVIYLL